MQVWPGTPYPLGATYDGAGTNFALFSEVATGVDLCLVDDRGRERRVPLHERDAFVWHGYLAGVGPGQRYGYRVSGPFDPARGQWCNPKKLLLDPYAKAVEALTLGEADSAGRGIIDPTRVVYVVVGDRAIDFSWEGLPGQTFEDLLTQIRASDAKMDQAAFYLRTYRDQQYVRNYVTLVDHCTALVGTYNADARHHSVAQFLQANLPAHIDQGDVTTDCRETP